MGGFHLDVLHVRSVGGILYYTILYYTPYLYIKHTSELSVGIRYKVYNGIEREKMENFFFFFFFFVCMSFNTKI